MAVVVVMPDIPTDYPTEAQELNTKAMFFNFFEITGDRWSKICSFDAKRIWSDPKTRNVVFIHSILTPDRKAQYIVRAAMQVESILWFARAVIPYMATVVPNWEDNPGVTTISFTRNDLGNERFKQFLQNELEKVAS